VNRDIAKLTKSSETPSDVQKWVGAPRMSIGPRNPFVYADAYEPDPHQPLPSPSLTPREQIRELASRRIPQHQHSQQGDGRQQRAPRMPVGHKHHIAAAYEPGPQQPRAREVDNPQARRVPQQQPQQHQIDEQFSPASHYNDPRSVLLNSAV
jgi:hypothetical protein